jgi:hypothetical protein
LAIGPDELGHVVAELLDERVARIDATAQDDERGDGLPGGRVFLADNRGLRDRWVIDERGLDFRRADVVPRHEHDVVDAAQQPEVAVGVALGAVAGEVLPRNGSSRCCGSFRDRPMPRSIDGHGR